MVVSRITEDGESNESCEKTANLQMSVQHYRYNKRSPIASEPMNLSPH